jgi:hypothetical protein
MLFRLVSSSLLLGSAAAFLTPAIMYHHQRQPSSSSSSSTTSTSTSSSLPMGKVVVELDKVTGLQDKDRLGTSDPYVRCHFQKRNSVKHHHPKIPTMMICFSISKTVSFFCCRSSLNWKRIIGSWIRTTGIGKVREKAVRPAPNTTKSLHGTAWTVSTIWCYGVRSWTTIRPSTVRYVALFSDCLLLVLLAASIHRRSK